MPINQLNSVSSVSGGDQLAIGSTSNGDDRRASVTTLQTYMQDNLTFDSNSFVSQYNSPTTGANVTVTDGSDDDSNVHLILTPAGTLATLTITLPLSTSVVDKQEVLVNCTQAVTALTVSGNGATLSGDPTSLSATGFFRMKFDSQNTIWYRVG